MRFVLYGLYLLFFLLVVFFITAIISIESPKVSIAPVQNFYPYRNIYYAIYFSESPPLNAKNILVRVPFACERNFFFISIAIK